MSGWRDHLRHFLHLLTGTAAAQLVNLAAYPLLARIYAPDAFGLFALLLAVSAVPTAIACGRFDVAIPIAEPRQVAPLFMLCCLISAAMGGVALAGGLAWMLFQPDLSLLQVVLMAASIALSGVAAAATMVWMRADGYRRVSASLVLRTLVTVGVQIGLGLWVASATHLMLGIVAGLVAQMALLLHARQGLMLHASAAELRAVAARFRAQVTVDIPSTMFGALALNLLTWFLFGLYGQAMVGFHAMANRIAMTPLALFNDTLGQVFYQKAAKAKAERGHFWTETKFNLLAAGAAALVILAGIIVLAQPFIAVFLGDDWAMSATILLLLAPMLAVRSVGVAISTGVFVLGKPVWLLLLNLAICCAYAAAWGMAHWQGWAVEPYLELTSLLVALVYLLFTAAIIHRSRREYQLVVSRKSL